MVARFVPRIRGMAWSFAGKRGRSVVARGEDLLSHLYFVLCRRAMKIDPDRPDTHWVLVGRCKYEVKNWYLSLIGNDPHEPLSEDIEGPSSSDLVAVEDEIGWILGRIPKRHRKVLMMRAMGYSREEIADELGCSVESVKKLAMRGMRTCRLLSRSISA